VGSNNAIDFLPRRYCPYSVLRWHFARSHSWHFIWIPTVRCIGLSDLL